MDNIKTPIYFDKKSLASVHGFEGLSSLNIVDKKKLCTLEVKLRSSHYEIASQYSTLHIPLKSKELLLSLLNNSFDAPDSVETIFEDDLIIKGKSLDSILSKVLAHSFFNRFHHIQIIIHPNGSTKAHSISIKHKDIIKRNISVLSFNTIFKKVKQSKNKSFNQSELKNEDVDTVGSFLAKEVTSNSFSYIVLLSSGDFFAPSEDDKENFDRVITINKSTFDSKISNHLQNIQLENVKDILKNFPIPLEVKLENDILDISYDNIDSDTDFFHRERLELMGELLNTLRHELSNPLFGINISSSLLKTDSIMNDEAYYETIDEIGNSSLRCQRIIDNFSHLYEEDQDIKSYNLYTLIKETIVLTKSESKFYRPEIRLINIDKDHECKVNQTLLSQILFNLIVNSSQALKDSDKGEKRIFIDVELQESTLKISIIDTGPGISNERVFDPFFTTKTKGTGLGLSICKNICSKIGAQLRLDSQYQEGAKFDLIINGYAQ